MSPQAEEPPAEPPPAATAAEEGHFRPGGLSPRSVRSDLAQVLAQLSEVRTELEQLHSGQEQVQLAMEFVQKDLAALPSKVLRGVAAQSAAGAKDRERAAERAREAAAQPLGAACGLASPKGDGRSRGGHRSPAPSPAPGGFGFCGSLCCQSPERVHRMDYRGKEVERKAPGTAASPGGGQQQGANGGEALLPSSASQVQLLARSPTKDSTGSKRETRSKAWLKKHNTCTGADLANVEGWNWASKHKSMASMDRLEPSGSITDSEAANQSPLRRVVTSQYFDNVCICLIVCSSIFQGYQVDWMAEKGVDKPPDDFIRVHYAFTVIFLVEILLRAAALQRDFFRRDDASWNMFDVFVVGSSILEVILESFAWLDEGANSLQALRVLRILRVVRVVRIIRVFRFFRELRMMVYSIIGCVRSLAWAVTLLFIILYTVASYFTQVATDYRATAPEEDPLAGDLDDVFGSLAEAIYYLFQAVSGGSDWGDVAEPLLGLGWFYAVFFSLFTCFTLFAVLNIVTGVFVEGAIERAQMDKEAMIQNELDEQNANVQQLELVFKEIDQDGSGILEMKEFEILMEDPRVKAWFRTMGLQVETARHLFRLLDLDNSSSVSSSEFVMGCLRLQGGAKNVDVATLMYENKRMMLKWTAFMEFVEEQFNELKSFITEGFNTAAKTAAANSWLPLPVAPAAPGAFDEGVEEEERPSRSKSRWSTQGTSLNLYEEAAMEQAGAASAAPADRKSSWRAAQSRHGSSLNVYTNEGA